MKKEKLMFIENTENSKFLYWKEISITQRDENNISIHIIKDNKEVVTQIIRENNDTKVIELLLDDRIYYIVDFFILNKFFEDNNIIFANRVGLHKEIKRYIYYSLN